METKVHPIPEHFERKDVIFDCHNDLIFHSNISFYIVDFLSEKESLFAHAKNSFFLDFIIARIEKDVKSR